MITELHYSNTNTYLIEGSTGSVLFDTGWAGTFPAFCRALGAQKKKLQDITYILLSHFHPDHIGIAQEIASHGPTIAVAEPQRAYIHSADSVFFKEKSTSFLPIDDTRIRPFSIAESRSLLHQLGIDGEILHTPGHSDDSISLWLDEGIAFVGDLNPLYELALHKGTRIEESWNRILDRKPSRIYYGHAKPADLTQTAAPPTTDTQSYALVERILHYIRKNYPLEKIQKKTGAEPVFIQDVTRMYLTHQDISVQGILDRIEIKGK